MSGLKIQWKNGKREVLIEFSRIAIVAILIAVLGVRSVSDLVPQRVSDYLKVIFFKSPD